MKPNDSVALPQLQTQETSEETGAVAHDDSLASETSTVPVVSAQDTPATSRAPSETHNKENEAQTPSANAEQRSPIASAPKGQEHSRKDTRSAIAVPNISTLSRPKGEQAAAEEQKQEPAAEMTVSAADSAALPAADAGEQVEEVKAPSKPEPPKSWADLVRTKNARAAASAQPNGVSSALKAPAVPKSASLAEALRQYTSASGRLSFLEPRGLVNTGNMCYMNSVCRSTDH